MRIQHANLENCATAAGAVVVIDVIRAFTTAAFAFTAGARDIRPVSTVEEALALRERTPGGLLMGEVGGLPPPGFDFGNSPSALIGADLWGRRLVQRTGAGTQGLVRSIRAKTLLACSFVCAGATVDYLKALSPARVTLVSTGPEGEDQACAAYIEALLRDQRPDTTALLNRVRQAGRGRFDHPTAIEFTRAQRAQFAADLECCVELDRFDFAMLVQRRAGLPVMEKVYGAYIFRPMDEGGARTLAGWRYEAPYDIYNLDAPDEDEIGYFLDPQNAFYRLDDAAGEMAAFCSFGPDGRVPGGDYRTEALDIGLGVRPDLTGQGRGLAFAKSVLDFARRTFAPPAFRVTVAEFNRRALRVWEKAGFQRVQRFARSGHGKAFFVLRQKA